MALSFTSLILVQTTKKNNQQALYRQALQYADEKQNVMQQRIEENESALALLQDRAAYLQQEKEFYTVLASKIRE